MAISRTVGVRTSVGCVFLAILAASIPVTGASPAFTQRSMADAFTQGPGIANHPVDVVPSSSIQVPSGWPLGSNGKITCSTCHDALPALDGSSEAFLRDVGGPGQGFCQKCHGASLASGGSSAHWMAMGRAHVREQEYGSASVASGRLDTESARCLGCHDGVTASDRHNTTAAGRSSLGFGDRMSNHPIGVGYGVKRGKTASTALRPVNLLPSAVRLPQGKVSCVSCHNLYSPDPNHLTVSIENSSLCFTCHNMG